MKKNNISRDDKRRLLLSKKHIKLSLLDKCKVTENDSFTYDAASANGNTSGSAVALKLQGMNRRVVAVVLAICLVLGLLPLGWFSLHGKAEGLEGLLPVTMSVRANGANNYTTAEVAPGNISETIASADFQNDLPSGVTFQKAVMKDNNTGTETEIKAVSKLKDGSGNEKVYYAFDNDADTGTLLKSGQELILIMAAKYSVTVTSESEDHGRVTTSAVTDSETSNYVWGGNSLRVQITPDQDYAVNAVSYTVNGQTRTATVNNNSATIPANDITGNISVNVSYAPIENYGIYEVQYMPNSKYYPNLYQLDNQGGLTTGKTRNDSGASETTGKLKDTPTGQDAVFYLYSKSNTGGDTHVLNMLSINGVDINFPATTNNVVPTDFGNERIVTVEMKETRAQLIWNGDTSGTQQYRTYYEIIIPDVHEEIEVALNFKEIDDQQIIIKGLRGISETGAALEKAGADRYIHLSGSITDSLFDGILNPGMAIGTRNYVKTTSKSNIYDAYYNQSAGGAWSGWIPSNNYYIYQVKPGYNPYSVKGQNLYAEYYDQNGTLIERVQAEDLLAGDSTADRPDEVIKKAAEKVDASVEEYVREQFSTLGEFGQDVLIYVLGKISSNNSEIRFWGSSTDASLINGTQATRAPRGTVTNWNPSAEDLILTSIKKEETADPNVRWYAIALNQNEAKNQQLYMNAVPFNYSLQLDTLEVNDVTFSTPTGYTNPSSNIYLETAKHTVEDNQAYIVTPAEVPTRTGYVFEGWQLDILNGAGTKVGTKIYQSNEQVVFTDDVLRSGIGDPENSDDLVLPLKAIWTPIIEADTTKVRTTVYYQDNTPKGTSATIGDQLYNVEYQSVESQTTGEYVALLNTHAPAASKYYALNVASRLEGYVQAQQTESDYNEFTAIYDLRFVDFTLKKEVNGNISASQFDITLTLTRPADYPAEITNQDVATYLAYSNTDSEDTNEVSVVVSSDTITFTKTFKNGNKVEFTNLPYGWEYTVSEAKTADDNFDTIINTEGKETHNRNAVEAATYTGALEENTDVIVNNQRAYDDPNIVSDKWLEKDANGTYKLTMETYATGKDVTDEDAEVVPLDIALVIDQSGSMGTKDMYPDFFPTVSKNWTVEDATSNQVYYYKPDSSVEKYYPVEAEEGVLFEKVANPPDVQTIKGWGHDTSIIGGSIQDFIQDGIGSRVTFNVPTSYYALDENEKAHKVFLITVGGLGAYRAYAYYYTDEGKIDEQNAQEFYETIYWFRLTPPQWRPTDLYKTGTANKYTRAGGIIGTNWYGGTTHTDSDYAIWTTGLFNEGSAYWMNLAYDQKVAFVGQANASVQSAENAELSYSWISNGSAVNDLYLPKDGTTYNRLYYVDDNGDKQYIGNSVDIASASAYNGVLYTVEGRNTRLEALQSAVTDFTEAVAQSSAETGADHRIGIIGFAGNKFPGISTGETAYNTTKYDYTDTGLFINNDFKNYQSITSYKTTSDRFVNMHYYIQSGNSYVPISYKNGNWVRLDNGNTVSSSTTFYEPEYIDLYPSDYQGALVEASQMTGSEYNGLVNNNLQNAIANFGHYGGTYTSYGMAMANNMFDPANGYEGTFEDSQGNTQNRKRIIIVFTDGEPGASGYSDAIAKEALADGNKAKYSSNNGGFNATVYTVGLFPGNITPQMEDFMRELSSDYTVPSTNVYGGTNNGVSETGSGSLDGDSIYFYLGDDGKTYSVTTQHEGLSTLGWWSKSDTGYNQRYPKTADNDSRTVNGISVSTFYNSSGEAVYEENLNTSEVYFTSKTTRNNTTAIKYEYRWYDSNNKIRDPIKQTYGTYDTERNTYQFFALGTPESNSDGYEYYHPASNTEELAQAFVDAFEVIKASNMGNTMTLTDKTSFIKDALSEHFVWDEQNGDIELYLIGGGSKNDDDEVSFSGSPRAVTNEDEIVANWDEDENAFVITGFDFSKTYVDQNNADPKANQKLRIVVTGLKPKVTNETDKTGGIFESNLKESGVFKQEYDEEHDQVVEGSQKLLDAFPRPSISRYKYTIEVDGDDTAATHGTSFELLDKDGNPVDGKTIADLKHDSNNSNNWSNGVVQNTEGNQIHSIILEQINDVDQFEVRLEANQFKHSDGIPDDYQVQYTVSGNNMNTNAYEFSKSINGGSSSDYDDEDEDTDGINFTRVMSKDRNTTVHISSEEQMVLVNIQEITEAVDPTNDFSDPTKAFDVILTLLQRDGQTPAADYTYGNYEFDHNGQITVPLANADSITLEIPKGYYLSADVEPDTQDGYTDTYRNNGVDVYDSPNVLANELDATQINGTTFIQVINKNEAPVVTGFDGIDSIVNPFLIVAGIVAALGGAWLGIVAKRKRQMANE